MSDSNSMSRQDDQNQRDSSAAHISRIEEITNATMRRISAIRRDPERVSGIASELRQRFRPERSNASTRGRGRGRGRGRPTLNFRIRVTCLQGPVSSNRTINHERLRELGLGIPPHEVRGSNSRGVTRLSIDMDADQVDDYFCSIFPALRTTPYDYCYANASGEIHAIESTLRSASDLHDFYVSTRAGSNIPTMYIRPREQITYRPLGTPTVLGRSRTEPTPTRAERSGEDRASVEPLQTQASHRVDTDRRTPTPTPITLPDSPSTSIHQESTPQERSAARLGLIAQQDEAYQESLRIDRARARDRQLQEEAAARQEAQRRERETQQQASLQQMRYERRRSLSTPPSEGFPVRFRLPDGTAIMRSFTSDMDILTVMNFVGSQETATRSFILRLPGNIRIGNERRDVSLRELDVTRPMTVFVEWIEDNTQTLNAVSPQRTEIVDSTDENTQQTETRRTPRRRAATRANDFITAVITDDTSEVSSLSTPSPQQQLEEDNAQPRNTTQVEIYEEASSMNLHVDETTEYSMVDFDDVSLNLHLSVDESTDGISMVSEDTRQQPEGLHLSESPLPEVIDIPNEQASTSNVLTLTVRRPHVVEDLLKGFKENETAGLHVKINFENEMAADYDGVFRDCLTAFWGRVIDHYFEGITEASPRVNVNVCRESWEAMGRILVAGLEQVGYFPVRFSQASLIYGVLGREHISSEILIDSFIRSLGNTEGSSIRAAMTASVFSSDLQDEVIEILGRYGVRQLPTPENCKSLVLRCSEVACVEQPLFPLQEMNLRGLLRFPEFRNVDEIKALYARLQPDTRQVVRALRAEVMHEVQQQALDFLKRSIRSFDDSLLKRFLRFVTGSDVMNVPDITIHFNDLYGGERRFLSRTCIAAFEVPITYDSFNSFLSELTAQLMSDCWEMDFS